MLTQAPAPRRHIGRAVVRATIAATVVRLLIPIVLWGAIMLFGIAVFVGFAAWASQQPAGGPPLIESSR